MAEKKLRILLAESTEGDTAETLRAFFDDTADGLELTVVGTVATLIPTIRLVDPEIIFLDLAMSPHDPLDAVRLVHRSAPGTPLVVLADPSQKQYAAQSLSVGAMDYVLKGFLDGRTLDRLLRGALARNTFEGLTDLLRDPMTGLYSREGLLTLGVRSQEEAQRTGGALVLICALFENLHTLREGFGPGAADDALRDVAQLLMASCRSSDVVARLGQAQFAMLAVDAAGPSKQVMRQRLEKHVAVHNEARSPWGPIDLRVSAGAWKDRDTRSFEQFLDTVEADLRFATPLEHSARAGANDA